MRESACCVCTVQGYPDPDKDVCLAASSPIRGTVTQSPTQGAARTPLSWGLTSATGQFLTQKKVSLFDRLERFTSNYRS